MKNLKTTFLVALLFSPLFLFGQNITPITGELQHNDKTREAWVVNVEPESKGLKKAWKDYLKKNYDIKLKGIGFLSNKDVLFVNQVVFKEISLKTMDFYTKIVEDENGSEMTVFGSFGYDFYINSTDFPEEFAKMNNIMTAFLQEYVPNYYKNQLKDVTGVISNLAKDEEKLTKRIENDNKNVVKMESKILNLEKSIEETKKALIENEAELTATQRKLTVRNEKLNILNTKLNKVNK